MVKQLIPLPGRGVSLEVDILTRESMSTSTPDPDNGGSGPVLVATRHFARVVRYNMRGAGASGGTRALHASVDAADLAELARQLLASVQQPQRQPQQPLPITVTVNSSVDKQQQPQQRTEQQQQAGVQASSTASLSPASPGSPRLVLVGYSYGSLVVSRALPQLVPNVAAVAAVAVPLGAIGRLVLGAGGSWEALAGSRSAARSLPRLLCAGDRDQFASVRQLRSAVQEALRAEERAAAQDAAKAKATAIAAATAATVAAATARPSTGGNPGAGTGATAATAATMAAAEPSLELVLWPGCDHFFFDCRDDVALAAAGLLAPYGGAAAAVASGRGGGGGGGGGNGGRDMDAAGASATAAPDAAGRGGAEPGGGQLQPGGRQRVEPWKALAGFVVGWLVARTQAAGPVLG
ncbi:hypothetical protein PLESTB_001455100 [Pleodorina starrii]|uniref:Uncharacterized protein n=1 Tax=Pleodorina starrii TaxID=330485 RepID=A0A9W6BVT9_9CHLO|nr:hypothetical protein PLESTB_001455100 [Pleodorina starrii]